MSAFDEALAEVSNDAAVAHATLRLRLDVVREEFGNLGGAFDGLTKVDPYDTERILESQAAVSVQYSVVDEFLGLLSEDLDGLKAALPLVQTSPARTAHIERVQAEQDAPTPTSKKAVK